MSHGIDFISGGAGSETLVFLHGIGGDASSFHHQMSAFDGFKTVAWNMPGYGTSEVHKAPPDFAHLSSRLAGLIGELGSPVHLVGHSIGGMIALDHAIRAPHQVASLCLIAAPARFGGQDTRFKDAFLKARLNPLDAGQTMAEMAAASVPNLVGPDTDPAEMTRIEAAMARIPAGTWRNILQCLVTFDRADELNRVDCATLVVAGEIDTNVPARTLEKMAQNLPYGRYLMLETTGHFPHQERQEEFNAALADFLSTLRTA